MKMIVKVRDSHEVPLTQQNEANVSNTQYQQLPHDLQSKTTDGM